jgi:hypothetical protein
MVAIKVIAVGLSERWCACNISPMFNLLYLKKSKRRGILLQYVRKSSNIFSQARPFLIWGSVDMNIEFDAFFPFFEVLVYVPMRFRILIIFYSGQLMH